MAKKTPIAVVGMAGIFPGASDLNTFWQNIVDKVDTACEVPRSRWIAEPDFMVHPDPMPDKAFSKQACLIDDFKFDPQGIDLDKDLLKALDPLHQMALHTGREALSSCVTASIDKNNIGTVLAAIALPTDASSSITRKILGTSFEEKLFNRSIPTRQRHPCMPLNLPATNCGLLGPKPCWPAESPDRNAFTLRWVLASFRHYPPPDAAPRLTKGRTVSW